MSPGNQSDILATQHLQRLRTIDADWPVDRYVSHHEAQQMIERRPEMVSMEEARRLAASLRNPDGSDLVRLALRHNNISVALASHNDMFIEKELERERSTFDASSLTERQRLAVVTDADVTLVVAGAGTGKTTTIIAKIDYLVRTGRARPDEILVVAYNKQAQLELTARLQTLEHGKDVRALTFHAFGYGTVRRHVDQSPEPVTDSDTRSFVHRQLQTIRRSAPAESVLRTAIDNFRSDMATSERTASFVGNILNLLSRFKTRRSSIADLRARSDTQRQRDFVVIFERIVNEYNQHLESGNLIDFSDMIVRATDIIEQQLAPSRFKYILIDEFQDITQARWHLITTLRRRNPGMRLFVVGDDWQSIYAFDDADVSIMTSLEKRESGLVRIDLDTTFRFSQPLADISSRFIMRNPQQLAKHIASANPITVTKPMVIHRSNEMVSTRTRNAQIKAILEAAESESHVLLLGRYRKSAPDNMSELKSLASRKQLTLAFHTCHAAKGLEADEVIVLDVNGGAMGFPCRLTDDEYLQLLPAPGEPFPDAEERRLFYVAITRSKGRVHLIVDESKPSSFLDDLEPGTPGAAGPKPARKRSKVAAERLDTPPDRFGRTPHCPSCNKPTFVKRVGARGPFWGCSDFPKCWGRPKKCPNCGALAYVLDSPHGNRYCAECGE